MTLSRRRFLQLGGALAAAGTTGCDRVPEVLRALGSVTPADDAEEQGPFGAPSSRHADLVTHAINRLSFGARPGDRDRARALHPDEERAAEAYVEAQLAPESLDDRRAERLVRRIESLAAPVGEMYEYKEQALLHDLTRATVLRARYGERQLHEVMVQFWTDHFNIDSSKGDCRWLKAWDDREVIRAHALGRFPELLRASALSPAMLWYLDGRVNRRSEAGELPNENYARELLELHTLGVHGGYTQRDVMEVARAFTGWTVRSRGTSSFGIGRVEFHAELHDDGAKFVLGQEIPAGLGARDVDAVLDVVALHPATARHIATKLCRRFIADEPPDRAVALVADTFRAARGDIRLTLRTLFGTEAFRRARATKLKRPFEYVISALRATNARTDGGLAVLDHLLRLGHAPFQYPTPEGYADDASSWLATLLWRWDFAVALTTERIPATRVDGAALVRAFSGDDLLMAHFLGRSPTAAESRAYHDSGAGLALLLASPAFQRC